MLGHEMTLNAVNHLDNNGSKTAEGNLGPKTLDEILEELGIHEQSEGMVGQDPFPCAHCTFKFRETAQVSRHMREAHPDPMRCRICGHSAANSGNLLIHSWAKHKNIKPFKCVPKCGQRFLTKQSRNSHASKCQFNSQEVRKESGMSCPHCPEKFMCETTLFAHVKTHEDPMICKTCGKESKNMGNFSAHWRTHTKEKPWSCVCGKRFSIKTFLKTHFVKCQNIDVGKLRKRTRKPSQRNQILPAKKHRVSPSASNTSPRGTSGRQHHEEDSKKSFITPVQHVILSRARAQGMSKLLALTLAGVSLKNGEQLEWDIPPVKVEKPAIFEKSTMLHQTQTMSPTNELR